MMSDFFSDANHAKILIVGPHMDAKGGIASVLKLYASTSFFQKDIAFLPSYQDGGFKDKLFIYSRFMAQYVQLMFCSQNLQLVHVHVASRGSFLRKSLVIILARLFGKKIILHVHGAGFKQFYENANAIVRFYIRQVISLSDQLVALSKSWEKDLFEISAHPNISVLYNPAELGEAPVAVNKNKNSDFLKFVFMGRLGARKGVYDLIDSASFFNSSDLQVHLYGDGEVEAIRQLIAKRGLDDRFKVFEWVSGPVKDQILKESDVIVLPSYHEGLPISILEAMAYGKPVIATNVGGIPDAVIDCFNGYLIEPGDSRALAERMMQFVHRPEQLKTMGAAGYQMAAEKFSLPVIINQVERLYAQYTR